MGDAPSQDATKSTSQRRRAEKQGDSELALIALVPHRVIEHDPGEEATLRDAEEETDNEEAGARLSHAHERRHHPPPEGQRGQPESRLPHLENQVAGDLEEDIADEIQRQPRQVLVARHVQVGGQALDARVADIAPVEEGKEIQKRQGREESEVEFPHQRGLVDSISRFLFAGGIDLRFFLRDNG